MSHKTTTFTVISAFRVLPPVALNAEVRLASDWAAAWLGKQFGTENVGFTASASYGGGAGWDTEPGVSFVFAGLTPDHRPLLVAFCEALRSREGQEAVVLLSRVETFTLID